MVGRQFGEDAPHGRAGALEPVGHVLGGAVERAGPGEGGIELRREAGAVVLERRHLPFGIGAYGIGVGAAGRRDLERDERGVEPPQGALQAVGCCHGARDRGDAGRSAGTLRNPGDEMPRGQTAGSIAARRPAGSLAFPDGAR